MIFTPLPQLLPHPPHPPSHPTLLLVLVLAQWFVCLFYRYSPIYGAQQLLGVRPAMECDKLSQSKKPNNSHRLSTASSAFHAQIPLLNWDFARIKLAPALCKLSRLMCSCPKRSREQHSFLEVIDHL